MGGSTTGKDSLGGWGGLTHRPCQPTGYWNGKQEGGALIRGGGNRIPQLESHTLEDSGSPDPVASLAEMRIGLTEEFCVGKTELRGECFLATSRVTYPGRGGPFLPLDPFSPSSPPRLWNSRPCG